MSEEQENTSLMLPDQNTLVRGFTAVKAFQAMVHQHMIEGHDYGVIPGTGSKATLLKPGAEKIAKLLGLSDEYSIMNSVEDWDRPLFRYLIKCSLRSVRNGCLVSEGLGECNSMEAKYRWRESQRKCPSCGTESIIKGKAEYGGGWLCFKKKGGCGATFPDTDQSITSQTVGRVENDDIYTQVNTILKMAKKRALVDAALSAGRLSDIFTQDLEDIKGQMPEEPVQKANVVVEQPNPPIKPAKPPTATTQPTAPADDAPNKATKRQCNAIAELRTNGFDFDKTVDDAGYPKGILPPKLTVEQAEYIIQKAIEQGFTATNY